VQVSVEKPGAPAEVLEHHGVKGQKWGVRKHATSAERTRSIRLARAETFKQRENFKTLPRGSAERKKAKEVFLRNPDRATALRFTRGEKIVVAIMAGVPVTTIPTAVLLGTQFTARKVIERKQAKNV